MLWGQHSGVPARITVLSCHGVKDTDCWGVLRHVGPNGLYTEQEMYIDGTDRNDIGHDVDVHIHNDGRSPIADTGIFPAPLMMIAAGALAGIAAVVAAVMRRQLSQRRPTARSRLGPTEFLPRQ